MPSTMFGSTLGLERALLLATSRFQDFLSKFPLMKIRYHVPSYIQEHVDYITPGIKLFTPARKEKTGRASSKLDERTFGATSAKGQAGVCTI